MKYSALLKVSNVVLYKLSWHSISLLTMQSICHLTVGLRRWRCQRNMYVLVEGPVKLESSLPPPRHPPPPTPRSARLSLPWMSHDTVSQFRDRLLVIILYGLPQHIGLKALLVSSWATSGIFRWRFVYIRFIFTFNLLLWQTLSIFAYDSRQDCNDLHGKIYTIYVCRQWLKRTNPPCHEIACPHESDQYRVLPFIAVLSTCFVPTPPRVIRFLKKFSDFCIGVLRHPILHLKRPRTIIRF